MVPATVARPRSPRVAARRMSLPLLAGCACYILRGDTPVVSDDLSRRSPKVSMRAKRDVRRREVLDGSSLTKQFYDPAGFRAGLPPGWSPALVVALGSAAATYGGWRRSQFFGELRVLGGGVKNNGDLNYGLAYYAPIATLSAGRAQGQVSVEITPPASAPGAIDCMWASDADSGEIFEGRKFSSKDTSPSLVFIVARGRRIVPSVHYVDGAGVWEGAVVVAMA